MVKVAQMNFPPGYETLVNKIVAWFDNQIYGTWATRNKNDTRSAKTRNIEKTYLPAISTIWKTLTAPEKAAWASASAFSTINNYQLFTSDYSYRRKNGLELPGTPSDYHDMFSLEIANPGGVSDVQFRRDEKDIVGPIQIDFNYKKTENAPTGDQPFRFLATAYFFSLSPFKSRKVCPHVKTDNSSRASSSKPAMAKAPAKASTVVSLVGLPKLTGLPATNSGRQREVPLTCPLRTFSACSQLQSRATSPYRPMRGLSAGEKAVSEKGLSTMALLGKNLNCDTMRISP